MVRFADLLRRHDFNAGPGDVLDALRAMKAVALSNPNVTRSALRAVFVRAPEQIPTFNALFDHMFLSPEEPEPGLTLPTGEPEVSDADDDSDDSQMTLERDTLRDLAEPGDDTEETLQAVAYTSAAALTKRDFGLATTTELNELRRLAERVARRLATRRSRRMRPVRRGERADQRRTIRAALRTGGDPLEMMYRERRVRRSQLVVICDVSGSMEVYARLLLLFLCALQQVAGHRVESFVFSTTLTRVTPFLRRRDVEAGVDAAVKALGEWAGGTRIGQSLATFWREYGYLLDGGAVLVILSDGLDTGDTELLEEQMQRLSRSADRIIWLNPLAADPRYEPLAVGMRTALPYVDVFASGQSLADLVALEGYL